MQAVNEGKGEGLTVIGFPSVTTSEKDIIGDTDGSVTSGFQRDGSSVVVVNGACGGVCDSVRGGDRGVSISYSNSNSTVVLPVGAGIGSGEDSNPVGKVGLGQIILGLGSGDGAGCLRVGVGFRSGTAW